MSTKLDLLIAQMNIERMVSPEQVVAVAEKYGLVEERAFPELIIFNSEYGLVCADLKNMEFDSDTDWYTVGESYDLDWTDEDFLRCVYYHESNHIEELDEDFDNGVINMGELEE